jgi:PKHD-type hydroxylase
VRANPSIAIACLPFLGAAECDAILASLRDADWSDARVETPGAGAAAYGTVRSGALAVVRDAALLDRVSRFVRDLNRAYYQFALDGWSESDPATAMRYREGDHFDWHLDDSSEAYETRKLSFTVQLTDPAEYDGGQLEFAMYSREFGGGAGYAGYAEQIRQRGAITVFPAFHLHRVSAVTRGTRVALVGWLHGPRFR